MKLKELKTEIQKYQYFEDTKIIDVCLASIIATRLKLGDVIWLIVIGASSGGKSQILRPLSMTDDKYLHRVDDLTENTFLSGANTGEGNVSLLNRIGSSGIIVISDLTVLFSKPAESMATILSQFRMIYDGEMIKYSGNKKEPIQWKGSLGIIAGSTPFIYSRFEENAEMGERFIYYRMKDYDPIKATNLAMNRGTFGKSLDEKLASLYAEYIKEVVSESENKPVDLSEKTKERIVEVAVFVERVRTAVNYDRYTRTITRIPTPAMPMRVALQLTTLAKSITLMKMHEDGTNELGDEELGAIDWVGYSLANEEKRACLKVLAGVKFDTALSTQAIADVVGLDTNIIGIYLQNLASVKILKRTGDNSSLKWLFINENEWKIVRRIEGIKDIVEVEEREISDEDGDELDKIADENFLNF